ncbi:hypothetical protein SEA_RASPUTIA_9 [Microbacterium phage Rasputia]|nr:hypothetical protein SEA_RASPUTIA_9 [Microbacterium phage Rasputia]
MLALTGEHVLWRTGEVVTKLTTAHRHNGQTCLILHRDGTTERVVIDNLITLKEYL